MGLILFFGLIDLYIIDFFLFTLLVLSRYFGIELCPRLLDLLLPRGHLRAWDVRAWCFQQRGKRDVFEADTKF